MKITRFGRSRPSKYTGISPQERTGMYLHIFEEEIKNILPNKSKQFLLRLSISALETEPLSYRDGSGSDHW